MRVNINLASQKFEDVRSFVARAGLATAILAVLTIVLAVLAWFNYSSTRNSTARIRDLQQQIGRLEQQRSEAEAIERRPENRDVTDQKNFWNRQIAQRAFSWTQLFNDLQRIMPGRAYVISVAPELTLDNRLKLKLTIGSENHENGLELVRKMEGSERFRQPVIDTEALQKEARGGNGQIFKFEIETFYRPAGGTQVRAPREGM